MFVFGLLVNAISRAMGSLLSITAHERVAARATFRVATVNAALNAASIPWLGLVGAAVATFASGLIWNIILVLIVFRLLGVRPTIFR